MPAPGECVVKHWLKLSRLAVPALIIFTAASVSSHAQDGGVAHGKALVELNCATCHAIGRTDRSTHTEAPPFRDLSKRYPLDALEEAFAEGIVTGHPDMPEFIASPEQIADIIAYIETLNP